MEININDELVLDENGSYLVVSRASYKGKVYFLLLNTVSFNEKICYDNGEGLLEVNLQEIDSEILRILISMYKMNINANIKEKNKIN